MILSELRDSLSSVSDAVTVPVPDASSFERRVAGVRRRRTAGRVAGAVAAVAVVATGSVVVFSLADDPVDRTATPSPSVVDGPHWVPVVVGGRFHVVDRDILGPTGPAIGTILGITAHGVVVKTDDGTLARIDEQSSELQALVPGEVRTAYLDGDVVVYENYDGLIRSRAIEPAVASTDSAQTWPGRLMAAGAGRVLIAADPAGGLVSHDAEGIHALTFETTPEILHGVQTGGDVIAVRADDRVVFFSPDGQQTEERGGGQLLGALAPDGHAYAQLAPSNDGVLLVDPASADGSPVEGPTGAIADLGWAQDGALLVVSQGHGTNTLWRCSPDGTGCAAQLNDPTGTLRLR